MRNATTTNAKLEAVSGRNITPLNVELNINLVVSANSQCNTITLIALIALIALNARLNIDLVICSNPGPKPFLVVVIPRSTPLFSVLQVLTLALALNGLRYFIVEKTGNGTNGNDVKYFGRFAVVGGWFRA
jgi:hypothetical protein